MMKALWQRHQKLHIWLFTNLLLLALFFATRGLRGWMTALAGAMFALRRAVGRLCYLVSFSVMEALIAVLVVFTAVYLVWNIVAVVRAKGRRGQRAYSAVLGAVCIGLTLYVGSCYLWGVNYYIDGFQERSGIYAQAVSEEDLSAVTAYFARELSAAADEVERDESGLFAVPRQEILNQSVTVYDHLAKEYAFLGFSDRPPKPIGFSRFMSRMDFTGVYCPYTGESNVNMDAPACLLPATVAHELAHQRSIASEQECNFLAVLAGTTSGNETFAYSSWLLGYIHLSSALYRADESSWQRVAASLPETVNADIRDNNAYWKQFQNGAVKKLSTSFYDSYLKGYGEKRGIESYGTVVDLLVTYYRQVAQETA